MSKTAQVCVFFVAVTLLAQTALAQLNGHNLRGDFGLMSGSQAGPSLYAGFMYVNYNVDGVRDRNGDEFPIDLELDVNAIAPYFLWVTNFKILGGNYSVFASPSWANNALEAPSLGIAGETGIGFGDLYVQPVNLGWHTQRADFVAGLGFFAPTGRYEDGADDNTGLGMWSYEIFGGTTVFFDEKHEFSFSALASYETHSSKKDSDVKVGDLLTVEGGLGKSWAQGALAIGVAYHAQWKITSDDLGGPGDGPEKHQIFGVGPEVVLPLKTKSKFYGTLNLRYLFDFGVENNTNGNAFIAMATFPIPSVSLQ